MKRIQELEAERKSLRQAAHDAASEAKQLREQLSTMEATAGRDRQELADLRELAFSISSEEQETESHCTIDFPQHTTRNILVFGGHPSWSGKSVRSCPMSAFTVTKQSLTAR